MDRRAKVLIRKIRVTSLMMLILPLFTIHGIAAGSSAEGSSHVDHVLLISVDGLHQSDLQWYVSNHPNSQLATLVHGGEEFTNAQTPVPSDSDPGGTALMTGGDPRATGVYYDVAYSHATYAAGTTSCHGQPLSLIHV